MGLGLCFSTDHRRRLGEPQDQACIPLNSPLCVFTLLSIVTAVTLFAELRQLYLGLDAFSDVPNT